MGKLALAVNKDDLLEIPHYKLSEEIYDFLYYPNRVLFLDATLEPRPECETNTSLVQLLPYIVLMDKNKRVLSYRRGKAGGEDRLKNKCSIGFGGHVEEGFDKISLKDRSEMLALSALRELNEELGFELTYSNLLKVKDAFDGRNIQIFYSTQDEVSRVHLCLLIKIECEPSEINKLEDGVIIEPEWLTLQELREKHSNKERVLEGWSEIAIFNGFI